MIICQALCLHAAQLLHLARKIQHAFAMRIPSNRLQISLRFERCGPAAARCFSLS